MFLIQSFQNKSSAENQSKKLNKSKLYKFNINKDNLHKTKIPNDGFLDCNNKIEKLFNSPRKKGNKNDMMNSALKGFNHARTFEDKKLELYRKEKTKVT